MSIDSELLLTKIQTIRDQSITDTTSMTNICHIGPTGAGKSSLICYSLDYPKITFEQNHCLYEIKHSSTSTMPIIGNNPTQSQTELPAFFQKEDLKYIDLPGFLDTKGPVREILNAFANSLVFNKGRSIKLIFVMEISSLIAQRGGVLANIVKRLEELFGQQFPQLANSSNLVISKVSQRYSQKDVIGLIQDVATRNGEFVNNQQRQKYLKTIIENNRINIFPIPQLLTAAKIELIKSNVSSTPSYVLKNNSHVSLSEDSKIILSDSVKKKYQEIRRQFVTISALITSQYSKKYTNLSETSTSSAKLTQVKSLQSQVKSKKTSFPLKDFASKLGIPMTEVDATLKIIDTLQKLESVYPQATTPYEGILQTLFSTVDKAQGKVNAQILLINQRLEKQRIQKQLKAKLEKQRQENIRKQAENQRMLEERRRINQENLRREQERQKREAEQRQRKYEQQMARLKAREQSDRLQRQRIYEQQRQRQQIRRRQERERIEREYRQAQRDAENRRRRYNQSSSGDCEIM